MSQNNIFSWYKNKRVLITGHTGFKGSWMCALLKQAGAEVTGYALEAPTSPSLFDLCHTAEGMHSIRGDIRDLDRLLEVYRDVQPEIVIHMAAQPIVRESYKNPVYTYEVNVMGTVNLLECVRQTDSVRSVVNVTTDKVYKNREWEWGYRENEELNGYDPYSNSKSCSELVTDSYKNAFFSAADTAKTGTGHKAVSTVRAGNVIGGGDFAVDRIIPDCIRAAEKGENIIVRNPYSVRPYQHVLEPIAVYLMLAASQYEDGSLAGSYNVGPEEADCYTTGRLVDLFCKTWQEETGRAIAWKSQYDGGPHEANFLKLDCSKLKKTFHWKPVWNLEQTMRRIVEWSGCYLRGGDVKMCMEAQTQAYIRDWNHTMQDTAPDAAGRFE